MPRATLTFDLPEELPEFQTALHGIDYKIVLEVFDTNLRNRIKYTEMPTHEKELLQTLRDELRQLSWENNLPAE